MALMIGKAALELDWKHHATDKSEEIRVFATLFPMVCIFLDLYVALLSTTNLLEGRVSTHIFEAIAHHFLKMSCLWNLWKPAIDNECRRRGHDRDVIFGQLEEATKSRLNISVKRCSWLCSRKSRSNSSWSCPNQSVRSLIAAPWKDCHSWRWVLISPRAAGKGGVSIGRIWTEMVEHCDSISMLSAVIKYLSRKKPATQCR